MATRYFRIPTPSSSEPITTQKTKLDGQTFRFDFRWNQRRELWELSLYDTTDTAVATGMALVPNWDVLRAVTTTNRPAGGLVLLTDTGEPSTLESLATDPFYYVVDSDG